VRVWIGALPCPAVMHGGGGYNDVFEYVSVRMTIGCKDDSEILGVDPKKVKIKAVGGLEMGFKGYGGKYSEDGLNEVLYYLLP